MDEATHRASADVHTLEIGGRELVVVGTAHISRESVDLVREVIEKEEPDCVCIELDSRRYEALSRQQRFESLDLKQVIRAKQLATLMLNLVLASYQKYLGLQLGIQPGTVRGYMRVNPGDSFDPFWQDKSLKNL